MAHPIAPKNLALLIGHWLVLALAPLALPADASPLFAIDGKELADRQWRAWQATVAIETTRYRSGARRPQVSEGTGFVIARRADGRLLIATAAHVLPAGGVAKILWRDGSRTKARQVLRRPNLDLALLESEVSESTAGFEIADLAASSRVKAGETVLALGYPAPSLLTAEDRALHGDRVARRAAGRLVEARQEIQAEIRALTSQAKQGELRLGHSILHTAPILPGASGGPLLDAQGFVIGIHVGSLRSKDGACLREVPGTPCLHLAAGLEPLLESAAIWQLGDR